MYKKIVLTFLSLALVGSANAATPLIQEGTTSLYQRVLTTPACRLYANVNDKQGSVVDTFSRYYVYGREQGKLFVGPDTTGKTVGYLDENCTVPWKVQTALMFNSAANRNRALIFNSSEKVDDILNAEDPKTIVEPMLKKAIAGEAVDGVIAIEPKYTVDFKDQFYLLPILDSEDTWFYDNSLALKLKIASVTTLDDKVDGVKSVEQQNTKAKESNAITAFKAGVVFVIDSSISMQPYIERTKQSINTIITELEKNNLQDYVQFGLVSFRSNTKAVPALQYESKTFVKPGEAFTVDEFKAKLKDLNQATVSSKLFDEDAYSGIYRALTDVNWDEFGGRYIILITDAGAIDASNELSTTHLDAAQLASEADAKNVAIFTMHLLTNSGKKANNHKKAQAQYRTLSYNQAIQESLYESIDAGDVNAFGQKVDHIAKLLSSQVQLASEGKVAAGSAANENTLDNKIANLGYAMQLRYLGQKQKTIAPDFIQGYLVDRDLINHNKSVVKPIVLLTKNELANMRDLVAKIQEAVNERSLSTTESFKRLREVAVKMSGDPNTLAQKGVDAQTAEFLALLPYKSRIANMTDEDWAAISPQEQDAMYIELEAKLAHYDLYYKDNQRWVSLSKDADPSEMVYPVPIEDMP